MRGQGWAALSLCWLLGACVARAPSRPSQAEAARGRPAAPTDERSAAQLLAPTARAARAEPGSPPTPNARWVAGYWHWNGVRYVWVSGRWEAGRPSFARR